MSDLTAEELALEAMLESRLEIISSRLQALHQATQQLNSQTQELSKAVDTKARRMYVVEDNLLRLQGKPGLSNMMLVNGAQPSRGHLFANKNSEIEEEIKMGFKTLRRKFQAAGAAVSTVGWWRHLKDKKNGSDPVPAVPVQITAAKSNSTKNEVTKLSVDTALANQHDQHDQQQEEALSPTMTGTSPVKPAVLSPKAMLSPTSSSTKRRTVDLQQIFTAPSPTTAKQPHQHYLISPSNQRAHPSLGLISPPTSPNAPDQSPTTGGLMRGQSLHS
ncbi:hypothetical protein BGZ65_004962 [Modicella reniformis]|uniref:Uncharacterized protein n=1 Tax=Modicella reniformis TaxID=1440133 RepID=A0A9P6MH21_9FUNG|nr:hypothetical protein BGZ65_004962 [Modicella reniformis]